ncbi:STAS domain-containing protein [Streptomyces sp. NPDC094149]|uniref:STAS domain-containing protein n=1 Tax=Streptomyces sp. NPDC094149 TaxID=3155079 RepID=UPI0033281D1B
MTNPHPPLFGLDVDQGPDGVVVRVEGDLDYETHRGLVDTVTPLLAPGDPARHRPAGVVRLDFAGLHCVDSSGLSALLCFGAAPTRRVSVWSWRRGPSPWSESL